MSEKVFLEILNKKRNDKESFKMFLNGTIQTKDKFADYVKGYNFSEIIDERGVPRADEDATEKSIDLAYLLIFAAKKYGVEFVLTGLLESVKHEKYSKLNPINWFLWIFNKIAWSEVKANQGLESDENFCRAIKRFQNIKLDSTIKSLEHQDFFKNFETFYAEDLTVIIQKIAEQYKQPLNTADAPKPEDERPVASTADNQAAPALSPAETLAGPPPPPPPPSPPAMPGTNGVPPLTSPAETPAEQGPPSPPDMTKVFEGIKVDNPLEHLRKMKAEKEKRIAEKARMAGKDKPETKPESKPAQNPSLMDQLKANLEKRRNAISPTPSESDASSVRSGFDDSGDEDDAGVTKKPSSSVDEVIAASSSVQQSPVSQPQGKSTIGLQTKPNKPTIPVKPQDIDASNTGSGMSSGSESGEQPPRGSIKDRISRLTATGAGMFAAASSSSPVKTRVSQLPQPVATPTRTC